MKRQIALLAAASLIALGGCKSKQAENVSNAPAEVNLTENYPEEMNAVAPAENNAAAEMNVTTGGNNAAAATNNAQ